MGEIFPVTVYLGSVTSGTKQLLLIRHGQSEWNALGLWQGQADPPLTELGERQAGAAVDALAGFAFDAVVTSNLKRANRTGQIIAQGLSLAEPLVEPLLAERAAGEWSGLNKTQIEEQYPGYLAEGKRPPGYESDEDLLPRIMAGLAAVTKMPGDRLAVVAHGGVIYVLEAHFGKPFERIGNLGSRWFSFVDGELQIGEREDLVDETTIPDQI